MHSVQEDVSRPDQLVMPLGEPIKEGSLVACYIEKYQDEEPQIARIINVKQSEVEVHWMHGSYFDPWYPCKVKWGHSYKPWIEQIPQSSILYEVQLSNTQRLTEPFRKKLKLSYSKL